MILTATDQLWRADITYIPLRDEFVFLAVILDAYSRGVIGWALDRTLEEELTLARSAWRCLTALCSPAWCITPNRGSQYASQAYTDLLKAHQIEISMSRKGHRWDKDYASYRTSFVHCGMTTLAEAFIDSLIPNPFRGGFVPGCSYRQSFLPL